MQKLFFDAFKKWLHNAVIKENSLVINLSSKII